MEPREQVGDSTGHLLLLLYSQIFRVLHFDVWDSYFTRFFQSGPAGHARRARAPEPDFDFVFSSNLSLSPVWVMR
jgi:hypothetical protein